MTVNSKANQASLQEKKRDEGKRPFPFNINQFYGRTITYLILVGWVVFVFYAVGWLVLSSLSTTREIFTNNLLATGLHFENYTKALTTHSLGLYFINSTVYVLLALGLIIIIAAPAAYVLSRARFRGRHLFRDMFVAGMGVPAAMLLIPLFMTFIRLNLVNTIQGLLIVYVVVSIPFTVYFLTGFFASLPREIEEAGLMDGCTDWQVFWKLMMPLAQPGLITVTIFNFIALWNDYFWALIFVNSEQRRTLMLGLEALLRAMRYTGDWAGLFASVIIVFLPTFILYVFLSEKIIAGVTAGAVKS